MADYKQIQSNVGFKTGNAWESVDEGYLVSEDGVEKTTIPERSVSIPWTTSNYATFLPFLITRTTPDPPPFLTRLNFI